MRSFTLSVKAYKTKNRPIGTWIRLFSLLVAFSPSALFAETQPSSQQVEMFNQAQVLLVQSNQSEEQAKQSLLMANKTRQLISKKRVQTRREKDTSQKNIFEQQASELAVELQKQQDAGAKQRIIAIQNKQAAMSLFSQALSMKWSDWISNTQPLTMDKETLDYISHNAVVRSVHPTMLNKMGLNEMGLNNSKNNDSNQSTEDADVNKSKHKMSLRIASLVGQSAPADLDISAFQLSNDQNYLAHIEVHNSKNREQTNVSQVPLNQMHQWRLLISDLDGVPVSGKNIQVLGHMPGHVHGLPTQPQVTTELDKGVYLVEGVKFQMQGWWVMQFEFDDSDQENSILSESTQANELKQQKSSFTFNLIL